MCNDDNDDDDGNDGHISIHLSACLLFLRRSPKRIADEAELASGFPEEDSSCFSSALPGFFVGAAFTVLDDDEVMKEMSGLSVEAEGWLVVEEKEEEEVEEEKEWAKESG